MDLISFDFYYPDAGPQEAEECRKNYEQYLYPKLRDHQRVMLVPYTAGCDPAVCFATNACGFEQKFPGIDIRVLTLRCVRTPLSVATPGAPGGPSLVLRPLRAAS